jgi:predicted DsbA family dithiol-disulfide isomerase
MMMIWTIFFMSFSGVFAEGDMEILKQNRIALDSVPVDIAMSQDGKKIFVLLNKGQLLIYSISGELENKIVLEEPYDRILTAYGFNNLVLTRSGEKRFDIVSLASAISINTKGSPVKGPCDAPVEIVVFSDFQCPSCAGLVQVIEDVMKTFSGRVKVVFKNYPLRSHPFALMAAATALAAERQDKFWVFHDLLFQNYHQLTAEKINELAEKAGLNIEKLRQDVEDPLIMEQIRQDISDGGNAGVHGTPTVFVDGYVMNNRSAKVLGEFIGKELGKKEGHESNPDD